MGLLAEARALAWLLEGVLRSGPAAVAVAGSSAVKPCTSVRTAEQLPAVSDATGFDRQHCTAE